jgi:hypothetical protein
MPSNKFKYQEHTDKIINCPPTYYAEKNLVAFRWVFQECDENSFIPVLIIDPKRQLGEEDKKCEGFALSLFEELQGAYQKYKRLVQIRPHLQKSFGNRIAELTITDSDGVCSEPETYNFKHFNIHEYPNANLSKKIVNIVEIFDEYGNFKR